MSSPSSGSPSNGSCGERRCVPVNLRTMSGIQQELAELSGQMEELVSCFAKKEQRLTEEATKATAIREAQRGDGITE